MDTSISSEDILEMISHKLSTKEIFVYTLMLEGMSEEEILRDLGLTLEEYLAMIDKFNFFLESLASDV